MYESPIVVVGKITRVLKPELGQVRLPNGKITLGHLSRGLRKSGAEISEGLEVEMEMTPFDFDTGRIARLIDDIPPSS